jgi:hypothetical protein
MDRIESVAAGDTAKSATWNGIQDQAASLYQVAWSWRGRRPTLAVAGSNLVVGAHKGCAIGATQAGTVFVPYAAETTIALSGLTTGWNYVYAYDNAGACAYQIVTGAGTTPHASLAHKGTSETHAYVGCLYATGASAARQFRMVNGVYVYRTSAMSPLLPVSAGTANPWEDVNLATYMPPHTRLARLCARLTWSSSVGSVEVRTKGDTTGTLDVVIGAGVMYRDLEMETDSSQKLEYQVTNASVDLQMLGFRE